MRAMNKTYPSINRALHLARRDVLFEKAVDLLYAPTTATDTPARIKDVERVHVLLKKAEQHAKLGSNCGQESERERDFLHFLNLIAYNVQSVHSMMLNQLHLGEEESFLCQFLQTDNKECALPAMAYGRRAEDILQGLWHVFRLALTPYRTLQRENLNSLTPDEKQRYETAARALREELSAKFNNHLAHSES